MSRPKPRIPSDEFDTPSVPRSQGFVMSFPNRIFYTIGWVQGFVEGAVRRLRGAPRPPKPNLDDDGEVT